MSELRTYPLRLPRSIRANLERATKQEGTSKGRASTSSSASRWPRNRPCCKPRRVSPNGASAPTRQPSTA
ncbi:MAG TPA: hypothetical protein PKB14_03760 [Rubrivivax sp.]|nr:hypothetical protein [Rubrivivax sp.]